ncbi:flagellar biosynthesis anti-sigma factor FlgM [Limnohabitans sp. DM1]|uniref:flagellar biosynthesis anti-sigma factor FlgM n=1 Tax=Limnohabitans sp. DM1 TaxID=1597955 RepID=UPI000AC7A2C4|nr:flagellar biosynthesis anti-sigma factor FlgM [Limnohabitans sp. DM1]
MKIPPLSDAYATSSLPTSKTESKVEVAGSGKTPAETQSLVVSLSRAAQSMAYVDGLVGVVNMTKVESVRAELQNGTFRINPEVIADRLLAGISEQLPRQD